MKNKNSLEELEKLGFKEITKTYNNQKSEKSIIKKIIGFFNKRYVLRVDPKFLKDYDFEKYTWCIKPNKKDYFYDYRRYSEDGKFLVVVGNFESKYEIVFYKALKKGMSYIQTRARKKVIMDLINEGMVKEIINVKESN